MLVEVDGVGRYRLLGQTVDDAVGEAFDKIAKLLGLPYPGGPALAALAESGDPERFTFPRPMLDRPGLDFSFSGLKTAVLLAVREHAREDATRAAIARGFEEAAIETLAVKCARALDATGVTRLVVAGGVGANRRLRARLDAMAAKRGAALHFPRPAFCTDNGAMIAYVGSQRLAEGDAPPAPVLARARWPIDELAPPSSAA